MSDRRTDVERVQLMLTAIRDPAIILLDAEGLVTSWSHGAAELHGFTEDQMLGGSIDLLYTEEDRRLGRPRRLLGQAAARGQVEDEGWRLRKDGSRFWADVILSAIRDPGGALLGFAKVSRDFTDRRQADDVLRASEERFRLMVDAVEEYAIFMLDPSGLVATWNSGARRIKGYETAEIVGRSFAQFYSPEDVAAGTPQRTLAAAARDGRSSVEGWRVRKDGSRFWAHAVITAVHDAAGALLGFVKVTRDLTERRRAEEEQLRLARAEEAIRVRDEFMLVASHELRTPLTALQLQLQSLQRASGGDEKLRERVDRALRSGERLIDLVESLLDVSRLATRQFALRLERFDLAAMLDEVIGGLQRPAALARCALTLRTPGPVEGVFDRVRLEQVVQNLVGNALKYGAGRPVVVSLAREGDAALIAVRDHGPGVAPGDAARIFDRFERAAPVRHFGGLGLGLYVSRQIVEAHGGSIAVRNADGGGAEFTVRVPLAQPEA